MKPDSSRILRMTKVAQDSTKLMQKFLDEVETDDEFSDVVGAWSQVLGAILAKGQTEDRNSFDELMAFVGGHIKISYDHNIGK